jgi:hypothetical protein
MFENKSRTVLVIAVSLAVLGTLGAYWYFRGDPQLARVEEMREQMRSEEMKNMTREQRREFFGQFRKEVEKLSVEQRRQLFAGRRNPFRERMEKYFQASRQEQVAILDQTIQREEQFRANQGNAALGQGFRGQSNSTPEDREKRRQQWLCMTTPLERAQMAEFRQQVQQRRQQLGLSPSPWGGRGGRG